VGDPFAAADSKLTAMTLDDAVGDPEAESRAVERLGGVEGLEDSIEDGPGHAVTGVGDRKAYSSLPFWVFF
jgi:hypothetical protein